MITADVDDDASTLTREGSTSGARSGPSGNQRSDNHDVMRYTERHRFSSMSERDRERTCVTQNLVNDI